MRCSAYVSFQSTAIDFINTRLLEVYNWKDKSILNRTKVTLLWAFEATYKAIWGVFRKVLTMGSAPDRKTWIN